jgi:hypothetical protein
MAVAVAMASVARRNILINGNGSGSQRSGNAAGMAG